MILDIMMPKVNGLEACRMIRVFSKVPILMVTAREDEETEISGIRCGADQYISKPVRMRAFMERVRALLLFLARTPNVIRSREQILQAVWNMDFSVMVGR